MNKKQLEILEFLKKKIIRNTIVLEHDTLISIYLDKVTKIV